MVDELKGKIRDIPNFPKDGIIFKDITTLLSDPEAYRKAIDSLAQHYEGKALDLVVGVEDVRVRRGRASDERPAHSEQRDEGGAQGAAKSNGSHDGFSSRDSRAGLVTILRSLVV